VREQKPSAYTCRRKCEPGAAAVTVDGPQCCHGAIRCLMKQAATGTLHLMRVKPQCRDSMHGATVGAGNQCLNLVAVDLSFARVSVRITILDVFSSHHPKLPAINIVTQQQASPGRPKYSSCSSYPRLTCGGDLSRCELQANHVIDHTVLDLTGQHCILLPGLAGRPIMGHFWR
jgi:hypothetical protein